MHEGCQVNIRMYRKVNEAGAGFNQYFAGCDIHVTNSPHEFRTRHEAYEFFRCDPTNVRFLFTDGHEEIPAFCGDLTELVYQVATTYENCHDGLDIPDLRIYEIQMNDDKTITLLPLSSKVIKTDTDRNDYKYVTLDIFRVLDGNVFATANVRIDLRG